MAIILIIVVYNDIHVYDSTGGFILHVDKF